MNKMIFAVSLMIPFISGLSYADQLCGLLQSHPVLSDCVGHGCVPSHAIEYTVTPDNDIPRTLFSPNDQMLRTFKSLDGSMVCAEGTRLGEGFQVTSITAQ